MTNANDTSEPHGSYLTADGLRTFCIDRGAGAPVVLLHGASPAIDAYSTWFRTVELLEPSFRVIAFDQVGFGRTDMTSDRRFKNRLERTPHAIAVLDELGVRGATIVGHSEGGFVVARMAIERPDLVARMVIVTSGGCSPALGDDHDDTWRQASAEAYDYARHIVDEDSFIHASRLLHRSDNPRLETVLRHNYRLARASGKLGLFRDMPATETDTRQYPKLQEQYLFPFMSEIEAPALLVWAADDATVPVARGMALLDRLPRADLHVFKHARHMVMHDRAEDFAMLIRMWCHAGTQVHD